jgi:crotonobetainyl-CoA:carnitine CoA-transferase CaiB-like acyl-CoA transferase
MTATPQPAALRRHAPDLGEHSDEVLKEMGYDAKAIADFRTRGVV